MRSENESKSYAKKYGKERENIIVVEEEEAADYGYYVHGDTSQ